MENRKSILPIFFTVFLDLLGLGIVIPILPAVIIDPRNGVLPMSFSFSSRTLIYGFLIASFPLAQFFGAPILGALADKHGRKKLLTISLFGTLLGYVLFAVGIIEKNIYLLFLGRILDGFTGGNISIAQSAIADISDEKTKSRNFGLVGMAFGFGFIIGPYIGGKLSDPSIISWFNYATPFWLSVILSTINIILVIFRFEETLAARREVEVSIFSGIRNIQKAFTLERIRVMFLVVFLLTVGFNFFTQFFQVFLIGKFKFNQSQIGDFFAYIGLWSAFAQGGLLRPLSKKFSPRNILSYSIILLAATFPVLLIPDKAIYLYMIIPFIAAFQGLTNPNATAIVSNLTEKDKQGEILGINQSIQSLAQAIPPIIAGFVTSVNINMPIVFAAISTITAWLVFRFVFAAKRKEERVLEPIKSIS